jgi:hypothetical protein
MELFHKFKSPLDDYSSPQSATLVKPSDWNEECILDPALRLKQFYRGSIFVYKPATADEQSKQLYNSLYSYYYDEHSIRRVYFAVW